MIRYRITHKTTYLYSAPVSMCHNKAHLVPRDHPFQLCRNSEFTVTPQPLVFQQRVDFFGNKSTFFTVQQRHEKLVVCLRSEVDVTKREYPTVADTLPWEVVRRHLRGDLTAQGLEAYEFVFDSPHIPRSTALADYAQPSFPPGRPLLAAVLDLTARIYRDFKYAPATTTVSTPLTEVMRMRRGVCQDFAHLQIGCLRSIGLAARYVSGYLRTLPPPGKPRLIGADASHAWLSVYFPGIGWLDFDPTNNSTPSNSHITLAWGRDYSDVSPIRGVILGGGRQVIQVSVDVAPADEVRDAPIAAATPAPAKPGTGST